MSGSGRHTLTGCPGLVKIPSWKSGRLSWMSGSGQEALPDVREWSGGHLGCPRVVGRPSLMSGSGRESNLNVQKWTGGPPGCPGVVERHCQMSGSVGKPSRMSGRTAGSAGVFRRPSRMSGSGRDTLSDVREWSVGPPGCPEVVGWPSRMCERPSRLSGSVRKAFPDVWETLSDVWEWSGSSLGCPGVVGWPPRCP